MVSETGAAERAYRELKAAILSGDLKLRQRLDIDTLAEKLHLSATPVRQALAILSAERLVSLQAPRGYYVAFWNDRELKELYEWRFQLARLALESFATNALAPLTTAKRSYAQLHEVFTERLDANANRELRRSARAADERLHAALRAEPEALPDALKDMSRLVAATGIDDRRALGNRLRAHYKRRIAESAVIRAHAHARAIPQNGD